MFKWLRKDTTGKEEDDCKQKCETLLKEVTRLNRQLESKEREADREKYGIKLEISYRSYTLFYYIYFKGSAWCKTSQEEADEIIDTIITVLKKAGV